MCRENETFKSQNLIFVFVFWTLGQRNASAFTSSVALVGNKKQKKIYSLVKEHSRILLTGKAGVLLTHSETHPSVLQQVTQSREFCQKMEWPLSRSFSSPYRRHANGVRAENTLAEFAWARLHYYQHHLHIDQEPRLWEINLINGMLQLGL